MREKEPKAARTGIYVDGPPHDYPDRQKRDDEGRTKLLFPLDKRNACCPRSALSAYRRGSQQA